MIDNHYLIFVGSLLRRGEHEMAIEACEVAQSVYLNLFQQRISNSTFSVDDAGMYFHTPQTMMLQNICSFLGADKKMVANIVVKWKCIYSEFRATLIQLGAGKHYIKTFHAIQQMKVGTKLDQSMLLLLTKQHKKETNKFLEDRGQFVLACLLNQSYEQIQSILQPNQLVLEYCIEREGETDDGGPLNLTGVLVVMRPGNEVPLAYPIDFKKLVPLAREWSKMLSNTESQQEAQVTAKKMCDLMLPSDVKALIASTDIKNVFMCPDMSLNILPLELLEFEDGEILGEKCTISYLSSSRELLRHLVVASVSAAYEIVTADQAESGVETNDSNKGEMSVHPAYDLVNIKYPSTNTQVDSPQEPVHVCKECVIVAAPNYDLEMPTPEIESTLWGSLVQGFASLFSESSKDAMLAVSLPGAETEAEEVRKVFMKSADPIKAVRIMKDDATMMAVLQLESPFILHFSTHGFSNPYQRGCRSSFWDDTLSGLLLAGSNTYRRGNHAKVLPEAGTGELTSLAACGMNLQGTRIVYLSACVSSYGLYSYGETINSLAQAFRSAGAQTVIATLWKIVDDTAQHFATYFYEEAFKRGVRPSEALNFAKKKIREETTYAHWIYWSCFVCIGEDRPLFP